MERISITCMFLFQKIELRDCRDYKSIRKLDSLIVNIMKSWKYLYRYAFDFFKVVLFDIILFLLNFSWFRN